MSNCSDPKDDKVQIMRIHEWIRDHMDFQTDVAIRLHEEKITQTEAMESMETDFKRMVAKYPGGLRQLHRDFMFHKAIMDAILEMITHERLTTILSKLFTGGAKVSAEQTIADDLDRMLGMKR